MCGIVGLFDTRGETGIDARLLREMNQMQYHRGPDAGGVHLEDCIGLGHRRLSIIDLSGGQQPLYNEDGSVVVVYNGEIYNFRELVTELSAKGHQFRTHCDTEVIVHAWEEWGERCVDRFRGMFAFGLWDRNAGTLFLARDRLGVKPLYYAAMANGCVAFASELKALRIVPWMSFTLDSCAVEEYFAYGYVPEPRSIYQQVRKLPPGHTLAVKRGARCIPSPVRYWDVSFQAHVPMSVEDAGAELLERLRDAVNVRLIAEVPLGAFLSGGVDSSAVVATMASLADGPVETCSISFGDPRYNESPYAEMVAKRFGTNHHVDHVEDMEFELVDRLAGLYDEPFADSSAIPTYRVCELARKHVTVALSGDGGDENLAGYRRYRWHLYEERLRSALPLGIRRSLFGVLGSVYPKADWAPRPLRAKSTFEALGRNSVEGYFHGVSLLGDRIRSELFSETFKRELQGYNAIEVLSQHARQCPAQDALSRVQYLDLKTYLPGDILTKVDRASMAHGLEVRVPLLDHHLVDWISGLSPTMKLYQGEGKYVFKKALERHLPSDVLYRRKMGFAVPVSSWLRGPLKQRMQRAVLGPVLAGTGIFNREKLIKLMRDHLSGQRDYGAPLWAIMMFEAFLRNEQRQHASPLQTTATLISA